MKNNIQILWDDIRLKNGWVCFIPALFAIIFIVLVLLIAITSAVKGESSIMGTGVCLAFCFYILSGFKKEDNKEKQIEEDKEC